jgi:Mn2+/Fe2+ NRAMP family transporter
VERVRTFFANLGPGLITGAADDDPSGISTYSVTGASFGYVPLYGRARFLRRWLAYLARRSRPISSSGRHHRRWKTSVRKGELRLRSVKARLYAAVLNGVLAPPLVVLVVLLTSRPDVMGTRVSSRPLRYLGWATAAIMTAAAVGMFATM